jgi:ribosomal-protein-alanine N-acetyltransferase
VRDESGCAGDAKPGGFGYFVGRMLLLQETIYTERLILRPFTLTDAPRVRVLAGDREIYETTLFVPYPYEDGMAESWISTHQAGFYEGRGVVFAICLASGTLIGAISLNKSGLFNSAELGYWIGVAHWNRGYCTEAAKAVLEYGFNTLRYHKISARHFVGNTSSGRVMEKAGMKREGLLQDDVMKDGRYITVELYGIVAAEEF